MIFHNSTDLDSARLEATFRRFARPWPIDDVRVFVRHTRSTAFSGLCCYRTGRLNVNLGRRNVYPFPIRTHIARPCSTRRGWWRPVYVVAVQDAYQLALFLFRHELYHWLVRRAKRNTRQKEGRCDRFAVRALVDGCGLSVLDAEGRVVPREAWDFQDLDGFVARAMRPAKGPSVEPFLRAAARPAPRTKEAPATMRARGRPLTMLF